MQWLQQSSDFNHWFKRSVPSWWLLAAAAVGAGSIGLLWKYQSQRRLSPQLIEFSNSIIVSKRLINLYWNEYDVDKQNSLEPEEVRSLINTFLLQTKQNKQHIQQYIDAIFTANNSISTRQQHYQTEYLRLQAADYIRELFNNLSTDIIKVFPHILAHLEQQQYSNTTASSMIAERKYNATEPVNNSISSSLTNLKPSASSNINSQPITNNLSNNLSNINSNYSLSIQSPSNASVGSASEFLSPSSNSIGYKIQRTEFITFFCMWIEHQIAQYLTLKMM
jgi:DNA repair ATPase RecN